jgi:hypothetical protein
LGVLSGALWLYAARIKVPTNLVSAYGGKIEGITEMNAGFGRQARWNGWAALSTALAAFVQAVALLI